MKKFLKKIIITLALVALAGGLGGVAYYRYKDKLLLLMQKTDEELDVSIPVAVFTAELGDISESLVLHGDVVANTEVGIYSTVPGKVKNILVEEGEGVNIGEILGYVDRTEAGLNFAPAPVESTVDGIVKKVFVENGDNITPQTPIFEIMNVDYLEVVIHIPEKDLAKVKPGSSAEIRVISYPENIFSGKVSELSPFVDPRSRTLETRIRISNAKGLLKPGMFGEVKLVLRSEKDVPIIPFSAVIEREGEQIVFIVRGGQAVETKPLFGIREGEKISVREGLAVGDRVIVIGQQNVDSGDRISITEEVN
jgi:multidrug efflux pump subunit AcrA (membrane-fusion protein)